MINREWLPRPEHRDLIAPFFRQVATQIDPTVASELSRVIEIGEDSDSIDALLMHLWVSEDAYAINEWALMNLQMKKAE